MNSLDHPTLRQFLAVAEAGTLRAAARRLNMSQPPLTARIRLLEDRLGVQLFERSVKGMRLTPAGTALAEDARALLGALARAKAAAGEAQPLRIGFVSAALSAAVPDLLRGLSARNAPTPHLQEMTTPQQLEALESGALDVGLLHPPARRLEGFESRPLGRDPFWAALPSDHRLARRRALRFAEIAREPFILFPKDQGPALHETIETLAKDAGATLRVVAEAARAHSQLSLVAGGLGVGLVTRATAAQMTIRGVTVVPLKDTAERLFVELHRLAVPEKVVTLTELVAPGRTGGK
ncbi:LysR family transcriptional regulator [Pelagibius sp.]|uniref:LysR family transcriptional regulator n=1 Tax=Pelagibius sp. TaxID=1931238 RepID=UPI002635D1F8|nr:LysR family transcriptional regulator [Pelagibius sp.]